MAQTAVTFLPTVFGESVKLYLLSGLMHCDVDGAAAGTYAIADTPTLTFQTDPAGSWFVSWQHADGSTQTICSTNRGVTWA